MSEPDLPPSALALFEAARREQPASNLQRRILDNLEQAQSERRARFNVILTWSVAALCVAAAVGFLVLRHVGTFDPESLRAAHVKLGPERISAPTVRSEHRSAPEPDPGPSPPPSIVPSPSTPMVPSVAIAPRPKPGPARATTLDLPRELELLGEAKAALAGGDPKRALRTLNRYVSLSKVGATPGQLHAEARALRIEALSLSGKHADADKEAREFLQLHPTSPLIDSVKRFVQESEPE